MGEYETHTAWYYCQSQQEANSMATSEYGNNKGFKINS